MITEIGLAQQRLFDDEQHAQNAHQPPIFPEPEPVQDQNTETAALAELVETQELPTASVQDPGPRPEAQQMNPSDDWSQSVSYNFFDSSSHTPSGQLNRADLFRDSATTAQTEPMRSFELRRWNSLMQAETSSPHDTEPFSSVISPKAARAKSDNATSNPLQPSSASVDELSIPATTEMPKVEKRGRKKKQPVPANDEDDELAYPESRESQPVKPEKRKPGRPPKNAKVLDETNDSGPVGIAHPAGVASDENQGTDFDQNTEPHDAGGQDAHEGIVDGPTNDDQSKVAPVPEFEQNNQDILEPTKQPKKKKLKRGKTTSVTQTKSHQPDVEDDVIWIDERPIPADKEASATSKHNETSHDSTAEKAPAPKKRGRKRKKTSDQLAEETAAAPAPEPDEQEAASINENNPPPQDRPQDEAGVSVVLQNRDPPPQTPEITNTIDDGGEQDQPLFDESEDHKELSSKPSENSSVDRHPGTPEKHIDPQTPASKGPGKHSPISSTSKVPYRVGLSKKARIAPLLKIIKR